MVKICLVFCKSEPQYAFKRYAYKKTCCVQIKALYVGQIVLTPFPSLFFWLPRSSNHYMFSLPCPD